MLWIFINNSEERKDPSIQYLSSHSPSFAMLVFDPNTRRRCMFVAGFEVGTYSGIKTFAFNDKNLRPAIIKYFRIKKLDSVGINYTSISLKELSFFKKIFKVKYHDISKNVTKLRLIKSKSEIESIKKACQYTDLLFKDIISNAKSNKFRVEADISRFISLWVLNKGLDNSFDPIVATGRNAASPHHQAGKSPLTRFTVLDFGIKYKGYCSDMSRTIFFGKPSKNDEKVYENLLNLQMNCIKAIKPGAKASEIDDIARRKLGKRFVHSLGHGVGVQIHEAPGIGPKSKSILQNGMTITIEPGYYSTDAKPVGIRIEDTLAILGGRAVLLTKSSKKFISIKLNK
jgi:Xaa-Pro aminopeptidase